MRSQCCRHAQSLAEGHTLELLLNDVVKLSHPHASLKKVAKKSKKRETSTTSSEANVAGSEETMNKPKAAKPIPAEARHVQASDKENSVSACFAAGKKQNVEKDGHGASDNTTRKHVENVKADDPPADEDNEIKEPSEAEWEDEAEEGQEHEEEKRLSIITEASRAGVRSWTCHDESVLAPEVDQARGDQWNAVDEASNACEKILVLRAISTKEMVSRFYEHGLVVLDAPHYALSPALVAEMRSACEGYYGNKLEEARGLGVLAKKGVGHTLKPGEEETVEGFNQRPGGRVDMILDNDEVFDRDWPWTPFVAKVLGPDYSKNYAGCVVARPGDVDQNWHIDGLHIEKTKHQAADRIIVFCPLTQLTQDTGTTEFVPRSHFLSRIRPQWSEVCSMPRARHYVHAGTPIVMDYRLWHRGLRNVSKTNRLLFYCVYQQGNAKRAIDDSGLLQVKRIKKHT